MPAPRTFFPRACSWKRAAPAVPGLGLGVLGDEYFALFRAPRFVLGAPPAPGTLGWAVITEDWAQELGSALGHPLLPGDKLRLSLFRNQTFTIREVTLAGVIKYQPGNEALRRLVITDGRVLRALCGYSQTDAPSAGESGANNGSSTGGGNQDIDSLFAAGPTAPAGQGTEHGSTAPISTAELKDLLNEAHRAGATASEAPLGHDGPWHFILLRTVPGANTARIAKDLRRSFADAGMAVQVRDWRGTAGGVASYVFLMQIVLYVGLFMLGGIVLILTMNSIVMSVFERTAEIGTMRAIGAPRGFVQKLFVIESCALTLVSGLAGHPHRVRGHRAPGLCSAAFQEPDPRSAVRRHIVAPRGHHLERHALGRRVPRTRADSLGVPGAGGASHSARPGHPRELMK